MMNWTNTNFYAELWAAAFKIEHSLLTNNEEIEWLKSRWFIYERIPAMIQLWETHFPEIKLFYEREFNQLNDVETSLIHLSNFPQLTVRNISPDSNPKIKNISPEQFSSFLFIYIIY